MITNGDIINAFKAKCIFSIDNILEYSIFNRYCPICAETQQDFYYKITNMSIAPFFGKIKYLYIASYAFNSNQIRNQC